MKFTIHTLRPCREGETSTHFGGLLCPQGYVESSLAAEAMTVTQACEHARQKARKGERPMAWSPEPSRSYGGTKGHKELGAEAIEAGRHVITYTDGSWIPQGAMPVDDNVVDAEVTSGTCKNCKGTGKCPRYAGLTCPVCDGVVDAGIPKQAAASSGSALVKLVTDNANAELAERKRAAAMGDLPGDIRRALRDMEAAYGPAIATGIFLDNIGAQFNVRRVLGESDEAYRARMGEEISKPAASTDERKRELSATCREFVADKQAEHAAELEYASWIQALTRKAKAKPAWHALSPDLGRGTHQVNPDHGSALLPTLREGKA